MGNPGQRPLGKLGKSACFHDTRDGVLTLNRYTQTFTPSGRKPSGTEASGRGADYSCQPSTVTALPVAERRL